MRKTPTNRYSRWLLAAACVLVWCLDAGSLQSAPSTQPAPASRPTKAPTRRPAQKRKARPTSRATATLRRSSPSSRPTSRPSSRPAKRSALLGRARPSTRPTTGPASRKAPAPRAASSRPAPSTTPKKPKAPPKRPTPLSNRTGWLSIALSNQDKAWLDGFPMGHAPIAYIRVRAGSHRFKIQHPTHGTKSFSLNILANRHLSLGRRPNNKLGVYYVRGDQSEVRIYRYPAGGGPPKVLHRAPGRHCISKSPAPGGPAKAGPTKKSPAKGRCPFLWPGESLYIQADGRSLRLPSKKATLAVRSYLKKAGYGSLSIYSFPPGALFLNNKLYHLTPLARLPLPPGAYQVWIRNGYLQLEHRGTLRIRAGQHLRHRVILTPKGGGGLEITSKRRAQIFLNGLYRGQTPARVLPLPAGSHQLELRFGEGSRLRRSFKLKAKQVLSLRF